MSENITIDNLFKKVYSHNECIVNITVGRIMGINIRKGEAEDGGFIIEGNIHVTPRELEALAAIAQGKDNEEAAKTLGISYTTLRNHTYNVMKKLGATNRTQALVRAIEKGMLVISLKNGMKYLEIDNYYVCENCSRAFDSNETIIENVEPFVVNHVRVEPPDRELCPNEGCRGDASNSYGWTKVRERHPEYPEIPEKGKKYDIEELIEERYKLHD